MKKDDESMTPPSLSHELKTPLTGIRMMLQLLMEEKVGPLNDRQRMMVGQANRDCERLVDVIQGYVEEFERSREDGSDNDGPA